MRQEPTPDEVVGTAVRLLREAAALSQADLGRRMVDKGFPWGSRQTVGEAESGRRSWPLAELVAVADCLDVEPQVLFVVFGRQTGVRIGDEVLQRDEWLKRMGVDEIHVHRLVFNTGFSSPQSEATRRDTHARIRSRHQEALARRRENLAARTRYPGPTYVAEEPIDVRVQVEGLSVADEISLAPGVPYVARDRYEAEALARTAESGAVHRIERHRARRLRAAAAKRSEEDNRNGMGP